MNIINNVLINPLSNTFDYLVKVAEDVLLEGPEEEEQQEKICSSESSDKSNFLEKQRSKLREGLRYTVLYNNFVYSKPDNVKYFYKIYNKIISLSQWVDIQKDEFEIFSHQVSFEVSKKYYDEMSLILSYRKNGSVGESAISKIYEGVEWWHKKISDELDDFKRYIINLLSDARKDINEIKIDLNKSNFSEKEYESFLDEINYIREEYCINEFIKEWQENYRDAMLRLNQTERALHQAAAMKLQSAVGGQELGLLA